MAKVYNTIMTGLDAAGKTTIKYKLYLPDPLSISRIQWNAEEFKYKDLQLIVWDHGGQERIRPLWRHYYSDCKAIIWVVDAYDMQRLHYDSIRFDNEYSVHQELHRCLNEKQLQNAILCVLLNKKDLLHTYNIVNISMEDIQDKIGMFQYNGIDSKFLKSILKKLLPNDIIEIIAEYTPNKQTGPCEVKRIHIDHIFESGLLTHIYLNRKICGVICSYLPPYKYINGKQKICKVFETCATSGDGLRQAFDWVNEAMKTQTKRNCLIM
eukprot:22107_1